MDYATVSVVTIGFNDLQGLRKTRHSVLQQVGDFHVEHIIIDGGSKDGTADFLRTLPDDVTWFSESDQGRYDAMNKGISHARGDLVWFMNSGDTFGSPMSISSALATLGPNLASLRASWGYGLARKVTPNGDFVGIFGEIPFVLSRFAFGGHPIPHQAAFFGTDIVRAAGEYSLEHGLAADQLYMLQCALISPPRTAADFLCDFDVSGAGSSRSVRAHFADMRKARQVAGYRSSKLRLIDELRSYTAEIRSSLGRLKALTRRRQRA